MGWSLSVVCGEGRGRFAFGVVMVVVARGCGRGMGLYESHPLATDVWFFTRLDGFLGLFRTYNPHPLRKAAKTPDQPVFTGAKHMLAIFDLCGVKAAFRRVYCRQV